MTYDKVSTVYNLLGDIQGRLLSWVSKEYHQIEEEELQDTAYELAHARHLLLGEMRRLEENQVEDL